MDEFRHLVFVYGSLKAGFGNHALLDQTCSEFVLSTVTEGDNYHMFGFGQSFPGVIHAKNRNSRIRGEVYRVSDQGMKLLDQLESNGHLYQRELVKVQGMEDPVWMYIYLARADEKQKLLNDPDPDEEDLAIINYYVTGVGNYSRVALEEENGGLVANWI
jgi:gamma-glutamylaminecyclotransferase